MWTATLDDPDTGLAEIVATGTTPESAVARLDIATRDGESNDDGLAIWTDDRDGKRYVVPAGLEYPIIGRVCDINQEFAMFESDEALEAEAE